MLSQFVVYVTGPCIFEQSEPNYEPFEIFREIVQGVASRDRGFEARHLPADQIAEFVFFLIAQKRVAVDPIEGLVNEAEVGSQCTLVSDVDFLRVKCSEPLAVQRSTGSVFLTNPVSHFAICCPEGEMPFLRLGNRLDIGSQVFV